MAYEFVSDNYVDLSLQDLKKAARLLYLMRLTAGKLYLRQLETGSEDDQGLWRDYKNAESELHSIIPPASAQG